MMFMSVYRLFAPLTVSPMDVSPRTSHFVPWVIRPIDVSPHERGRNVHGSIAINV